jgi:hypothetical protein
MKRHFEMYGTQFHLNEKRSGASRHNKEFFSRYKLLYFNGERWIEITGVNSKSEAIEWIMDNKIHFKK